MTCLEELYDYPRVNAVTTSQRLRATTSNLAIFLFFGTIIALLFEVIFWGIV